VTCHAAAISGSVKRNRATASWGAEKTSFDVPLVFHVTLPGYFRSRLRARRRCLALSDNRFLSIPTAAVHLRLSGLSHSEMAPPGSRCCGGRGVGGGAHRAAAADGGGASPRCFAIYEGARVHWNASCIVAGSNNAPMFSNEDLMRLY
jgi:hypothetical protein